MHRHVRLVGSARALVAALAGLCIGAAEAPTIEPGNLSEHVRTLASDAFEGRAPGTAGEQRTIDYVAGRFAAFGLRPGGDGGGWTQSMRINRISLAGPASVAVRAGERECTLDAGEAMLVWTRNPASQASVRDAPLVFAGYGVHAPDRDWDDYAGVDVRGKVVVVLANDPDYGDESGPFGGRAMTYYGRLAYKAEEAARRGALAVVAVHDEAASGYSWTVLQSLYSTPTLSLIDAPEARLAFSSWLRGDSAERLFACAGLDLAGQVRAARNRGFAAVPLDGVTLSASFATRLETTVTHNIIGLLPGTERPGEAFLYTAHWDHLGRGRPDSAGDEIYNGALDNAGGVAGLLELARLFAAGPRPDRSVVFIATTLEENGLLGAEYYAAHPLIPLDRTVGGINMDAVNLFGPTGTMEVTGLGQTELESYLEAEVVRTGRRMQDDPNSVVGFYYRSDHFPFVKRGVPFLFAGSGWDLAGERARNTRDPELGTRFHQPSDEWRPDLDFEAAARDIRLYHAVGLRLANSADWPAWRPGAEFGSQRWPR